MWIQHDAVISLRHLHSDIAISHVPPHFLDKPLVGIAPTATAAGDQPGYIPPLEVNAC
jgi:hypothetical protein